MSSSILILLEYRNWNYNYKFYSMCQTDMENHSYLFQYLHLFFLMF